MDNGIERIEVSSVAVAVRDMRMGERLAKVLRSRVAGAHVHTVLSEYSLREYMLAEKGYFSDVLLVDQAMASLIDGIDRKPSPPVVAVIEGGVPGFTSLGMKPDPDPFTDIATWVSGVVAALSCHRINGRSMLGYGQRYEDLVNALPDIVYELDTEGVITFINDSVSLLGYRSAELVGRHFSVLLHEGDAAVVDRSQVLADFAGNRTGLASSPKLFNERRSVDRRTIDLEVRLRRKPGTTGVRNEMIGSVISYGEVSAAGEYARDGKQEFKGTVGIIRDMTFRRKSEEMLRKLYQAIDQLGVCVFMLNHAFEIEYVNPSFFQLTGFSPADVIDHNVFRFFALLPEKVTAMVRTLLDGFDVREEALVPRSAGGEFRAELLLAPVRSPSGAITHSILIAEDVSSRESVEEQLRNARLEAEQLYEEKNLLLSGISREMRNPVNAILSAARSAMAGPGGSAAIIETVLENANSMMGTLDSMRDYVTSSEGNGSVRWMTFPFREFIEQECGLYRAKVESKGLRFSLSVERDDIVQSEPQRLGRVIGMVFEELLGRMASGEISLDASMEYRAGNVPHLVVRLAGKGGVVDSRESREGIGVTLARNIVKTIGGEIRTEEGPEGGSAFTVMVPAARPVSNSFSAASRYTVLVVDDNEVNLEYTRTLLENYGYRVHCATGAAEALRILGNHFVDAALLDLRMPGTDGKELARIIRGYTGPRFSPDMPLFAMTAHGNGDVLDQDGLFLLIFPKPADILQLSSTLVEAMLKRECIPDDIPFIPSVEKIWLDAYSSLAALSRALSETSEMRVDVKAQVDILAARFGQLGCVYGQELVRLLGEHYAGEDRAVLAGLTDRMSRMLSACFSSACGLEVPRP
jgi:PAS domain S-box-containing protein